MAIDMRAPVSDLGVGSWWQARVTGLLPSTKCWRVMAAARVIVVQGDVSKTKRRGTATRNHPDFKPLYKVVDPFARSSH